MISKQFSKRLLYLVVLFISVGIYSQCLITSPWNIGNVNSANPINIPTYFTTNAINVGNARMSVAMTLHGNATLNTARISNTHLNERGINLGHDLGTNTNSFDNRVEMNISFSLPVVNLAFRINDIDDRDNIIVTAYNQNDLPVNLGAAGTTSSYWSYANTNTAIVYQGDNRFRGGDPDVTNNEGSVNFNYTGLKISRIKVEYYDEKNDGSFTIASFSGATQCPIVANPDHFSATKSIASTTSVSVLGNDVFNSLPATTSNVTVSASGALPSGFTLNSNGTVSVANNVPVGVYNINYQICETAGVSNCSTSTATVRILQDSDGDTVPDIYDQDDDNDGILDVEECPGNLITNGSFTTNLSGWTAGTGWVYNSANGGMAINENNSLTAGSSLSQSLSNLNFVHSGFVSINLTLGAKDANNASGSTASLEVLLNGVVYATFNNSTARDATNVTMTLSNGAISNNFTTFGTTGVNAFVQSAPFTIHIPYSGPNTAALSFRMISGSDDWSLNDISINAGICDLDNDGIPNYLDLDSDGDGCTDAIEGAGNFTPTTVASGTLTTQTPNTNFGTAVNLTTGIPTAAGPGQAYGYSQNASLNACKDFDSDGIIDNLDLDSDNDGVLDTDEGAFCGKIGRNIRVGYLAVDAADDGLATNLLLNLNNFGTYGTYKNVTGVTLVPFSTVASVTEANLISNNIDVFFVGSTATDSGNATGTNANKAPTTVNNILTTWAKNTGKVIFAIQNNAVDFGYLTTNNNVNNDVPFGTLGNQVYTNGYWPTTSLTQTGTTQMTISAPTRLFNTLMVDANGRPVVVSDQEYNLVIFPDATIYISEANEALPTTNDRRAIADTWAYVFNLFVSKQCTSINTDGDAQPNHLDLDSDGDGCSDAFEAGATTSLAANYTFASVAGTATDSNSDGLADAVDGTPLDGIPNYVSTYEIATNASNRKCLDSDGDGILDTVDLDDDNDGILDTDEGFACTSLSRNLRIGYLNTTLGRNGLMINMLSNAANFSYTGTYKKFPGITFVPYATEAAITEAQLLSDNIDLFYAGSSTEETQGATDKLSTALNTRIQTWITNNNKGAIILQNNATDYGYQVTNNNTNNNVPYGVVGQRVFTNGYWPESTFAQSGSVQMTISSLANVYETAMVDAQGKATFIKDKNRKIVFFPDATIFADNVSAATISNSTQRVAADVWAYAFDVFLQDVCSSTDTDGDGIPNYLDLDSDNDGCPDSREGAGNFNPTTTASGPIASQTPNTNFGTAVNTTTGIPTLVGAGQGVGQSQSFAQNDCLDSDGDTIPDWQDLDDDNDGILDTVECNNAISNMYTKLQSYYSDGTGGAKGIVPSDFALALGAKNQTVTRDLSAKFGYPANSGALVITLQNASVHPLTNSFWTKDGEAPTIWTVSGKLSSFVLMAQNPQFYGQDTKTIHIYDGSTVIPFALPSLENEVNSAEWSVSETATVKTLRSLRAEQSNSTVQGDWRFVNMNFGDKRFGFSTTTRFADPTYEVVLYLECDSDMDGTPDRLDLDSDADGCSDAFEGGADILANQLLTAGGTVNGGSTSVNQNICTTCVSTSGANIGLPQFATLPTGYSNTTGQTVGDSQNGAVTVCYCTQPPAAGTGEITRVGISVQQKQANWPENIPNGHIVLESKEKGLVITRVAHVSFVPQTTDSIASPFAGMLVYDIQDACVKLFNGINWKCLERSCNTASN